ncbi:unnamed protein product [Rotaria sordida]|uniref:Uncharacterized protein n=1 Tax=Rotaria sordida TaxID=392033 RepID=A0A814ELC3_9BILA|nr:unnamed protein product [Rotaria sordida]CAF3669586.1 unnamed protein product [Rotaria sordida]CAF3701713.1 unnamed protein product [Rotaria sordida]CAF3772341.1 unnamed protein product [Rotaria sordida]
MQSSISFTLNINIQSSNAHNIRPILPNIFADNDIQRTIRINKISSSVSKKFLNNKREQRLVSKQCFLPLQPTIIKTSSLTTIDIQSKLESIILKTVDCEIIDLFNQIKSKPTTTAFNDNLSVILAKLLPSEHKYFFGSIVITDKIDSLSDDTNNSMSQERRIVMDQLRTLEFVQLQAFARVLQQQNKKSQSTIDKLQQKNNRMSPAQLLAESIKKQSLDKITFALIMDRILGKVDNQLSCLRDECYMSAVSNVQSLVQKDTGTTIMMTKIEQELSHLRNKVNHLTLTNEKYSQLITRLLQDIQHVHDMSQHDVKEAHNMRLFIQSLHDVTYQHRFVRSECKIIKRSINQLELGFFDNLIHIQLDGKTIGRITTWTQISDKNDDNIECKIIYSTDENLNQSQQLAYELLKNEINIYWNRPLTSTISMSYLIEFIRKLIEYSLIANNLSRTLIVCLETLPCKLIDNKFTIDWSTPQIRLDIEWELDERIFRDCPLKSSYCCQPQHNGLCNELQILLDRMKPINGSIASLYEQVEKHIRPWIKLFDEIQNDNINKSQVNISLQKLKQSLEKLLLEHN